MTAGKGGEKAGSRIGFTIDVPKVKGKYLIAIEILKVDFIRDAETKVFDQIDLYENSAAMSKLRKINERYSDRLKQWS